MAKKDTQMHPIIHKVRFERTYVMIKPDGVYRGLIGEMIGRFEKAGMKVVAMKMLVPTTEQALAHYPTSDEAYLRNIGKNTHNSFKDIDGIEPKDVMGTDDELEIGQAVAKSFVDFLTSGPVVCMVVEGIQAIQMVRKLLGSTLPFMAPVGTIRGDYSIDNPIVANIQSRPIHNLAHASGNVEEAEREIALWFKESEISDYTLSSEATMYDRYY